KNPKKRGNRGEPSKDRNVKDVNKRTRTRNAFATTTNPIGRENTGSWELMESRKRSGRFDVIIGMDWLTDHKAEIICHEKVVRIPLLDGKVLRVLGEKPKEKMRQLMSAKTKEKKQE
ncbi:putative reverse transcriptase domain-containing protein, partial [Tanacetum coccineum]